MMISFKGFLQGHLLSQAPFRKPLLASLFGIAIVGVTFVGCAHQGPLMAEGGQGTDKAIENSAGLYPQAPNYAQEAEALAVDLNSKMGEIATAEDMETMKAEAEQLAVTLPNPGLEVGETAPHFSLPNAFGDSVSLYSLLESGPVVLVFYRGNWCPYCNLHLRSLQKISPILEEKGAHLVAVTPQKPDESLKQLKAEGYPFEILSDLDYSVTAAFDLYFELSPDLQRVYKKFGVDLEVFNGAGRTALPVPGTFVIDQAGVIRAAQADTDYKKRMEPAEILSAVDALTQRK